MGVGGMPGRGPQETGLRQAHFPSICLQISKDAQTPLWKETNSSQKRLEEFLPSESEGYTQTPKFPLASGLHLPSQQENVRLEESAVCLLWKKMTFLQL